jgi:mRNA interferase MazF
LKTTKVRPAVVVASGQGKYSDLFLVPITSKIGNLYNGEFLLEGWQAAGLNVASAIKRGCVLVDVALIRQKVGNIPKKDMQRLNASLKEWLEL